jgi:N-acetylmuramoyl-L-alanine amidase
MALRRPDKMAAGVAAHAMANEGEHDHTVGEGECLSQIAFENGFFWETVWNHPSNAGLKDARKSPFVLNPGDSVHVPALREKKVQLQTGQTHCFKRRGVPAKLRVKLQSDGKALAGEPYQLDVDGKVKKGTTGGDGLVDEYVPPDAEKVTLTVGSGNKKRVYELALRELNPDSEIAGLKARLRNLGYFAGEVDDNIDDDTREAIREAERANGLQVTGEDSPALRDKLRELHGC